jgi:hypothetical protein
MTDLPDGASGLLVRGYQGREADWLVTRIDLGVVSLVTVLRGHARQTAEELEQLKSGVNEPRSPLRQRRLRWRCCRPTRSWTPRGSRTAGDEAIAGRGRSGGSNVSSPQPAARHGEPAQVFPANAVAADGRPRFGWRDRLESDPSRGRRAPQMGDRASADALRWNLDLILDQRGTWSMSPAARAGYFAAISRARRPIGW